jgi:hypothetical protein
MSVNLNNSSILKLSLININNYENLVISIQSISYSYISKYTYSYNFCISVNKLPILILINIHLPPPQAFQKYKIGWKRTERPAD